MSTGNINNLHLRNNISNEEGHYNHDRHSDVVCLNVNPHDISTVN